MVTKRRTKQLKKELKNKIISVNEIINTNEWGVVFVKTAHEELFIELLNNSCKNLKETEGTLEENEEIYEKFQDEEKVKKSKER